MSRIKTAGLIAIFGLSLAGSLRAQSDVPIYDVGKDVSAPSVVKSVKPEYTTEGRNQAITGSVLLNTVVLKDGSVGEVRVEESLDRDSGLDDAAVAAMRQWTFKPGMKDGQPVAVRIHVSMTFSLK